MDTGEARRILRYLADGTDPETGETFPMESPYQKPRVIRSLFVAVEALDRQRRSKKQNSGQSNAGNPWTNDEEERLINAFDSGMAVEDLARIHSRTSAAITARLQKLGRLEESQSQEVGAAGG